MKRWGLAAGGLAAGLLAGFLVWGPGARIFAIPAAPSASDPGSEALETSRETPEPTAASGSTASALPNDAAAQRERFTEELAHEIGRSVALEARIEELLRQLEASAAEAGDPDREPGTAESAATESEGAPRGGGIDESTLLAAGFRPGEVADIRQRLEEIELERLFVQDQAGREGWLRSRRFWKESIRLGLQQLELRDEYGEDAYDWILYAMGSNNRVVASGVIQDSPAFQIGLEQGDVIVAYAGQRILAPHELRQAILAGASGDNVALDVERDGEPIRFYLPVGPIGIRLETVRQTPRDPR